MIITIKTDIIKSQVQKNYHYCSWYKNGNIKSKKKKKSNKLQVGRRFTPLSSELDQKKKLKEWQKILPPHYYWAEYTFSLADHTTTPSVYTGMADLYYQLSTDDFSIPPFLVRQEVIFSEFEVFFAHLSRLSPILADKVTALSVKWND